MSKEKGVFAPTQRLELPPHSTTPAARAASGAVVVNFGHPLTSDNLDEIAQLVGTKVARVIDQPIQFVRTRSFADQAREVITNTGLSGHDWQRLPIVANLPGLTPAAAALLADLHGRMGGFPPVLVLSRVGVLNRFAVTAVLDLNEIRDVARRERDRDRPGQPE